MGAFSEIDGLAVGSIWATTNRSNMPTLVRTYMKLLPGEALVHDVFTSEQFRGMGIGPYMVHGMVVQLLDEYSVEKIIVDVSVRNGSSLRMMDKLGLRCNGKMLYVSAFGNLLFATTLDPIEVLE
jgi:hypothetical protein